MVFIWISHMGLTPKKEEDMEKNLDMSDKGSVLISSWVPPLASSSDSTEEKMASFLNSTEGVEKKMTSFLNSTEGVEEKIASSLDSARGVEEKMDVRTEGKEEERDQEDTDDGYQTPTSPRHRIKPAVECPPAPKKRSPSSTCRKMKGRSGWVRRRILVEGNAWLFFSRWEVDDSIFSPRIKKARGGEAAITM